MPLETLTQRKEQQRRLQLMVSEEAYRRIHAAAGIRLSNPSVIVSDLAVQYLPPVPLQTPSSEV